MTSSSSGDTHTYNHINRLTSYSKTGTTASYLYDPFGKRISKTVNGVTIWYLWDRNKLLTEYNNSGSQTKRYAYLPNQYTPIQVADANGIYTVHKNHLGAPILLTDSTKNIVWSAEYESFGQAVVNNDVDGNGTAVVFNFRFPGQYLDLESGLSYNRFRYYSSSLGRYITSDPIGLAGGINVYSYVRNNPLRFIDPYGLNPLKRIFARYGLQRLLKEPSRVIKDIRRDLGLLPMPPGPIPGTDIPKPVNNENANDDGSDSSSDGDSGDGKSCPANDNKSRHKGDRFTDGDDALDQYEDIQREQDRRRKQGDSTSIESIKKSKQRDKNALRPWNVDY